MIKILLFVVFPCPASCGTMRWSLGAKRLMLELHYVQNTLGWHGEAKYSRHLSNFLSLCCKLSTWAGITRAANEKRLSSSAIRCALVTKKEWGQTVLTKFFGSFPLGIHFEVEAISEFLGDVLAEHGSTKFYSIMNHDVRRCKNLNFEL